MAIYFSLLFRFDKLSFSVINHFLQTSTKQTIIKGFNCFHDNTHVVFLISLGFYDLAIFAVTVRTFFCNSSRIVGWYSWYVPGWARVPWCYSNRVRFHSLTQTENEWLIWWLRDDWVISYQKSVHGTISESKSLFYYNRILQKFHHDCPFDEVCFVPLLLYTKTVVLLVTSLKTAR